MVLDAKTLYLIQMAIREAFKEELHLNIILFAGDTKKYYQT